MKHRLTALTALILLALGLGLALPGTASAHSIRVSSDPEDGSSLSVGPQRVTVKFNEALGTTFSAMTVIGPDGNRWSDETPTVTGASISVGVHPLGPVGVYTINYRITSADGHPVTGDVKFTLTQAGTGTPGPPAASTSATASTSSDSTPLWPFLVGGVVIIVIVGGGFLWRARRS